MRNNELRTKKIPVVIINQNPERKALDKIDFLLKLLLIMVAFTFLLLINNDYFEIRL